MAGAASAGDAHGRGPNDSDGRAGNRSGKEGRAGNRAGQLSTEPGRAHARSPRSSRHAVADYLRANPQVFVLLVICIVLGLGTFLAVVFGLLTAGSDQSTGEPSGAIMHAHGLIAAILSP